jgi:flavin reductase (DIM6/NTAB) family NADH-FMN oxidoreductase RutF
MTDGRAEIHDEDPFRTPPELRSPERSYRGRLAAPVTIWTSGGPESRTGLTVSSLLLAEGEPSMILGLINDTTDLWDQIQETERFVVHVLGAGDRVLAERFAGTRPSPGGLFAGMDVEDSPYGPILDGPRARARCRYLRESPEGFHRLVRGEVESLETEGSEAPLVHYRGTYRRLEP